MVAAAPLHIRFWAKVARLGPDDCWLWTAGKAKGGYGVINENRKGRIATHVALELAGQPRPPGLFALHSCDTPACCNPAHLRWGTIKDNTQDSFARNRFMTPIRQMRQARGERAGHAKLTETAVLIIRASDRRTRDLARELSVSETAVSLARRRLTWKHVA